ncbi:glycosyltransferase family 4 protein [Sphingobacterium sp. E70]|uniref:glycosyltransferase family 4 protein n=1 Tax=Sphingobacterium sp. E70 TaxID=2853439 RepID=UPI00211C15A7|nr:glycosyltransferase family 4 protein [Sphingobacterium sp. E70]ULT28278.1 glycosyltransferase family 4 protein [Sphingobacterium sp. E70]
MVIGYCWGGEEQYVEMLKKQASSLGIVDKIRFLGYRSDVDELLSQSDYFILLSRGETFGMVYLEAMNSGLSIIAWDIPAVKEIVPSENLIMNDIRNIRRLFEPGYSSLYHNRQLINLARIKDRFSIDLVRKEYWEIYD